MKYTELFLLITFICISYASVFDPSTYLISQLNQLFDSRSFKGLQIQITKNGQPIFYHNKGTKNDLNEPIDSNTIFRIASCSKSFTSVAIMQLVEKGKLRLNDSISSILGYEVKNPYFPEIPITVEMILSHQTSIMEEQFGLYQLFLDATYAAQNVNTLPDLKQILLPGGRFYDPQMYQPTNKPGEYFHYSNLGYVIAGTVVQKVSGQRFDQYLKENVLDIISQGLAENATHNVATIKNYKNLGVLYEGEEGEWVSTIDNYNGPIPQKNLTGYKIGTNGAIFGPQVALRASVRHMNNYLYIYANKGVTKTGKRLLSQQSVNEILKPRYQYHGTSGGMKVDYHLYGLGIYTSSYSSSDIVISHETIRGHTGDALGLFSGYHYWKDYIFSYIINGALYGFTSDENSIYEKQRQVIHQSVESFINKLEQQEIFQ